MGTISTSSYGFGLSNGKKMSLISLGGNRGAKLRIRIKDRMSTKPCRRLSN
jgi:hypothetical protein